MTAPIPTPPGFDKVLDHSREHEPERREDAN